MTSWCNDAWKDIWKTASNTESHWWSRQQWTKLVNMWHLWLKSAGRWTS